MRLIFTFLLLGLATSLYAQKNYIENGKLNGILPIDENGKVTYKAVNQVEGVSKEELFKRARKWFNKTYKSGKDVLQINDASTGELSGKGYFSISESMLGVSHEYPLYHALSIEVKDGRYRLTMTDFIVDEGSKNMYSIEKMPYVGRKYLDKFYTKIDAHVSPMLASLEQFMKTKDEEF